jgi:hypothetical protein
MTMKDAATTLTTMTMVGLTLVWCIERGLHYNFPTNLTKQVDVKLAIESFIPPNLHLLTLITHFPIRVSRCRFGRKNNLPAKPTSTRFPRRVSRCRFGGRKIILPPNLHLLVFQ